MAAALTLALGLGSCSAGDETAQTASADGHTPIQIGTLTVGDDSTNTAKSMSRAYDATAGDDFTTWQWKAGEEVLLDVAKLEDRSAKTCIFVLAPDGKTWNVREGQTPIYLQDVEDERYVFYIGTMGGDADIEDIADLAYTDNGLYTTDQSTAKAYQTADLLSGVAYLQTGRENGATYARLSASLIHQNVDVVVNIQRGAGWGNTDADATAAFQKHMSEAAAPMIYAVHSFSDNERNKPIDPGYTVKPLTVASADGNTITCRAHLTLDAISQIFDANGAYSKVITDAPVLQLTTPDGSKLNATFSLSADQVKLIGNGKRLTINLVYDNLTGLHTQGITIGNWNDGGTSDMDGENNDPIIPPTA